MKCQVSEAELEYDRNSSLLAEENERAYRSAERTAELFAKSLIDFGTAFNPVNNNQYTIADCIDYMTVETISAIESKFDDELNEVDAHYIAGEYHEFKKEFETAIKKLAESVFQL